MAEKKIPSWLRVLEIIIGFVAIMLAMAAITFPGLAIETLSLILLVNLLIIGLSRVIFGIAAEHISKGLRTLGIISGLLSIALAVLAMAYPGLAVEMLIFFLAFALIFHGIARIAIAGMARVLPKALRVVVGIIGVLTVFLALIIVIFPSLGVVTLVFLLSFTFMIIGIESIASGITGTEK